MSSWGRGAREGPADIVPRSKITSDTSKKFVCAKLCGGIGNRFFQVLAGLGYAARTGRQFVIYERYVDPNAHMNARLTQEILLAVFPQLRIYRGSVSWTYYSEQNHTEETIPDLDGSVLLEGYFQNEKYFSADARANFSVPLPLARGFDISGLDFGSMYFVHFRNGDYLTSDFNVGLDNYYKKCIGLVKGDTGFVAGSKFLICSDQPELVRVENYGLSPEECVVVPASAGAWLTLHVMGLCRGGICANSTFSWFGAFGVKGNGPIYMPKKWNNKFDWMPVQTGWATVVDI